MPPAPSIISSGTSSATGISSWRSRSFCGADDEAAAETRAMTAHGCSTRRSSFCILSCRSSPRNCGRSWPVRSQRDTLLLLAAWPSPRGLQNEQADAEIDWLMRLISDVRSVRAEMNVPAGAQCPARRLGRERRNEGPRRSAMTTSSSAWPGSRAIAFGEAPPGAVQIVLDEATLALPLGGVIDIAAESKRLKREIDKVGSEIKPDRRQTRQRQVRFPRAGACGRGAARAKV